MRPARVLIADDDASIRALLTAFLRKEGYEVLNAANGTEAVTSVEREKPALVLLDMDMPIMNGYQAAREIRRNHSHMDLPIIALTGNDDPDAERRCREAGCTSYLSKPVTRKILIDAVRNSSGVNRSISSMSSGNLRMPASLLRKFLDERSAEADHALELLEAGAFGELARIGHQLKGSSGTLGFPAIGEAGRELERAAASENADAVAKALRILREQLATAERAAEE